MRNSPPGMGTRSFGFIFQQGELQLAFIGVHAVQDYADLVADGKLAAGTLAHDLADVLLISVLVARQSVDRDEPFDKEIGQFNEETILGGTDDQGVEVL